MEPRRNLQAHLAGYHIHPFRDQHTYERWAEQQLGQRWKQRLQDAYAGIHAKSPSHEGIRKTFDSSSHIKLAQVNLSCLYAQEFAFGDMIGRLIEGRKRVLDLGCNIGHLTTWYARIDPDRHVTGVDFSRPCILSARRMARKMRFTNVDFDVNDIEACDLTGRYDAIVETMCLKYIKDIGAVLRHLSSLLEPHGILVTTTLGKIPANDLNALLQSSGLSYFGRPFGPVAFLVAGKQADDGRPGVANFCPAWCDPATSQVILIGA
jgi:2-polyprenyl-3-methyl-5-hydroxy-6-metoxy-1,4-benzoquinol methylase